MMNNQRIRYGNAWYCAYMFFCSFKKSESHPSSICLEIFYFLEALDRNMKRMIFNNSPFINGALN